MGGVPLDTNSQHALANNTIQSKYTYTIQDGNTSINLKGLSNTSSSSSTTNAVLNTIFSAIITGGSLYAQARAESNSGESRELTAEEKAKAEENRIIAYLQTPEGVAAEIENANKDIKDLIAQRNELQQLLNGDLEGKSKQLETSINNTKTAYDSKADEGAKYDDIKAAINKKEAANNSINSLKAEFKNDSSAIAENQQKANNPITAITVAGKSIKPTVENGIVTTKAQTLYDQAMTSFEVTTPPSSNLPREQLKKDTEDYHKYLSAKNQESAVRTMDQQAEAKAEAQRKITEFKARYGENLDGSGGSYKTEMDKYNEEIQNADEILNNNPEGLATVNSVKNLELQKAEIDGKLAEYMTTEDGKEGTKLDKAKVTKAIKNLNEQIKLKQDFKKKLENISFANSNVANAEAHDDDLNKKDGNWFTRMFSPKRRALRKLRKGDTGSKANLANAQANRTKATQAYIEKMKLEARKMVDK